MPIQPQPRRKMPGSIRAIIGCSTLICVVIFALVVWIIFGSSGASSTTAAQVTQPIISAAQLTQTAQALATVYSGQLTQTAQYGATATALSTDVSTTQPAAVPTTQPTSQPTQPPPPPTPKPSPPPSCQAVNNNPWCYNFSPGNYITNPPGNFCDYFNCIASFWNGRGFVNECSDGTYSLSGGIRGDCSHHGGEWRPLYSH